MSANPARLRDTRQRQKVGGINEIAHRDILVRILYGTRVSLDQTQVKAEPRRL